MKVEGVGTLAPWPLWPFFGSGKVWFVTMSRRRTSASLPETAISATRVAMFSANAAGTFVRLRVTLPLAPIVTSGPLFM